MKPKKLIKRTLLSAFVLLSIFMFSFINPGTENHQTIPPQQDPNTFLIGALQPYNGITTTPGAYDLAGLNITHQYDLGDQGYPGNNQRHTPKGFAPMYDHLFDNPIPTDLIRNVLYNIYNEHNQSRFFWMRPKIEWLAYGQSSIYKAFQDDPNLGFYAFNNVSGDPFEDDQWNGGKTVLVCSTPVLGPGARVVLSRLKANTEQSRNDHSNWNQWQEDKECDWYVKPRIRIPASFIPGHEETDICIIHIKMQDGSSDKIPPDTIKAKHFLDENLQYDGRYLEEFYFDGPQNPPRGIKFTGDLVEDQSSYDWGHYWAYAARGSALNDGVNKADFKVEWLDNCTMWIDYVKVENDVADKLLKGENDDWIIQEVDAVRDFPSSTEQAVYNFYMELFEFNNIPCMAYVNKKIMERSGNKIGLMADLLTYYNYQLPWSERGTVFTPEKLKSMFFDKTEFPQLFIGDPYPLTASKPPHCDSEAIQYNQIPNTFNITATDHDLFNLTPPATYDAWLQSLLDTTCIFYEGGEYPEENNSYLIGDFQFLMKRGNWVSKACDKPFIAMLQAHQYNDGEIDREPTNEEENLMTNVAVSYGAKGIIYWGWLTWGEVSSCKYTKGLMNEGTPVTPRLENLYGEEKWTGFKEIVNRLKKWGPTLMSFDNTQTNSYVYRLEGERSALLSSSYFSDVVSYEYGAGLPPCQTDNPGGDPPPNSNYECNEDRYLQVATFLTGPNDINRYFMIVNRRCSPLQDDYNDGRRYIRFRFHPNSDEFADYTTWKITNIADPDWASTFIKSYTGYIDLGWFMPSEGRLYKISPVMPTGGTLLADENIEGVNFTCEDTVYNNGYNITIGANTTIHFVDSSLFVIDSGSFTMGSAEVSGSQSITSDAVTGNSWRGYNFNNCEVRIYGATFSGLTNDTTYAINIIDCPVVDIRNSTFSTNASLKGGINGVYYSTSTIDNIYIGASTFTSTGSSLPQVQFMSYAGITTPLIIENNTFNYGSTAILLSGVTGGAIKDNNITGNSIGINLLTSSVDVADNTIVSSHDESIGIFGASGSEIKMNNSGAERLGGANDISTTGTESYNMKVDNSYFLIDEGENIFNINETDAYHLSGFFNPFVSVTTNATENCFKFSSSPVDPPYQNVTWGDQGSPVSFTFSPYLTGCEPEGCEDPVIVDLGGGIYDTICNGGGGQGGGESSSIKNYELGITNSKHIKIGFVIQTLKQMYDSLSILMRHRNYTQAKVKCYELLNTYPDSLQSIYTISKLFLATIGSDTTTNTAQQLKTYYEGLILNHPNNTALVTRANYFIQKCKVRLRDYNSALSGFSQIINQNPYSYEALVARWDYMAASLLIQGSGGSEKENSLLLQSDESDEFVESDEFDKLWDDKSPYTKEQKQDIRKSINTALENTGRSDERKMKILEEASSMGDVNATRELKQRKTIREVVKTEHPRSIIEHVRIVAGDIRKVFGVNTSGKEGKSGNIPLVFRLSQNYPNPFNPVTKINYDLPRDAKVNIVIYDILGREVKHLLNNDFKTAGSYVVDFNASNYASGVYFYRIEAEEPNGNKFVDSKKMVLIK